MSEIAKENRMFELEDSVVEWCDRALKAESRALAYEQALRKAGDFAEAMIERGNKDNNVLAILAHIRAALGKSGGIPQTPDV